MLPRKHNSLELVILHSVIERIVVVDVISPLRSCSVSSTSRAKMDRQNTVVFISFIALFVLQFASANIRGSNGTSGNGSTTLPPSSTTPRVKTTLDPTTGPKNSTTTPKSTSTKPVTKGCSAYKNCEDCADDYKCYWCDPSKSCEKWPKDKIKPSSCSGNKWYWKQCTVPG